MKSAIGRWYLLLVYVAVMPTNVWASVRSDSVTFTVSEGTFLSFDVSPDGSTIVFDLLGQLWTVPSSGGQARALTDAVGERSEDLDPSFSPDGKWVSFRSDRPSGRGIWLISTEDGSRRQLTDSTFFINNEHRFPSWSPDGRFLSYVDPELNLQVIDVATGSVRRVTVDSLPRPGIFHPSWSPDGSSIVFSNRGPIWRVPAAGGAADSLTDASSVGRIPALSPDGKHLAMAALDSLGRQQLFLHTLDSGRRARLTHHDDFTLTRIRWSKDGTSLYYVADGGLWRVSMDGSEAQRIPFTASLTIPLVKRHGGQTVFPSFRQTIEARGFKGMAISPDGQSIAVIALQKLWRVSLDGAVADVAALPPTARDLAWTPDGFYVAWTAGSAGGEDIYFTDLASGHSRRVTTLVGREERPSFSPDGRYMAFLHWAQPGLPQSELNESNSEVHMRVAPVERDFMNAIDETIVLGALQSGAYNEFDYVQEVPVWAPSSDAILEFGEPWYGWQQYGAYTPARILGLDGTVDELHGMPRLATFVNWLPDGSLTFVSEGKLWRTRIVGDRVLASLQKLSDGPALYATTARDGTVAYVSDDGMHVIHPTGEQQTLGWPITFETPPASSALLIKNAQIVDAATGAASGLRDIYIENGRIIRISEDEIGMREMQARALDAEGRILIPGLMDLHAHLGENEALLRAYLYYGVTTVRDMGSPVARIAALRDEIEAGIRPGPRIVLGGFHVYPIPDVGGLAGALYQVPKDSAGIAGTIALARAFRASHLKLRYPFTWPIGVETIEQAHAAGLSVSGHCAHPLPLIVAGIDGLEHLDGECGDRGYGKLYDDMVALYRAADIWAVPTIVTFAGASRTYADSVLSIDPVVWEFMSPVSRMTHRSKTAAASRTDDAEIARAAALRLKEADVTLAVGTDVGREGLPNAVHLELEELVRSGISPIEAVAAATSDAARIIGLSAEVGSIEVGMLADFLILDGNPLDDIRDTRMIWAVIKGGELIDRSSLQTDAAMEITLDPLAD